MSTYPAPRPPRVPRAPRARQGMTLVEVLVAVLILGTVLIGLAGYMGRFTRDLTQDGIRNVAGDLVTNRLEFIKSVTRYDRIDDFAVTEAAIAGYPDYRRVTQVAHVQDATTDYRRVTVTVTHPFLTGEPVRKSTVVARF